MFHEKKGVEYKEYVRRQGVKLILRRETILKSIPFRIERFAKGFTKAKKHLLKGKILCLGARTGCEVIAARKLGFTDSIGVDLYPANKNDPLVLEGDWHHLNFPEESFENVFTNSIDHCFDLEKLIKEVFRVLIKKGCFFLMLPKNQLLNKKENKEKYMLESSNFLFWDTENDIVDKFCRFGFKVSTEWQIGNWKSIIMKKI